MAQTLQKVQKVDLIGTAIRGTGFDPIGDMIDETGRNADDEDKRIKQEKRAFEAEGFNATKESKLAQKEKKQRIKGSGLQSSATNTTSLLR